MTASEVRAVVQRLKTWITRINLVVGNIEFAQGSHGADVETAVSALADYADLLAVSEKVKEQMADNVHDCPGCGRLLAPPGRSLCAGCQRDYNSKH